MDRPARPLEDAVLDHDGSVPSPGRVPVQIYACVIIISGHGQPFEDGVGTVALDKNLILIPADMEVAQGKPGPRS